MTDPDQTATPAEHILENRRLWDEMAPDWVAGGEANWCASNPTWGVWSVSNDVLPLLPAELTGVDAVELGCGTGYVSAWLARRGAHVTGVDNSAAQLATARRLAAEHGLPISWIHADAEHLPLPSGCADFAISEYGAALWCRPERWLAEAARILRPGGRLVFLTSHPLAAICIPPDGAAVNTTVNRGYFDLDVLDWRNVAVDPGGIEFNRPISAWFRTLAEAGFTVEDFAEARAPAGATGERYGVSADWAREWPYEQVWWARRNLT